MNKEEEIISKIKELVKQYSESEFIDARNKARELCDTATNDYEHGFYYFVTETLDTMQNLKFYCSI